MLTYCNLTSKGYQAMKILFKNRKVTTTEDLDAAHWDYKENPYISAIGEEDHIRVEINSSIAPYGLNYMAFVVPIADNLYASFDQSGQIAITGSLQEALDAAGHQILSASNEDEINYTAA